MRRALYGVLSIIILLLAIVIGRTIAVGSSRQPAGRVLSVDHVMAARAAQRLSEAVRFQTVLLGDTNQANAGLDSMAAWMHKTYPRVFATLDEETFSRSVMLTWKGTDSMSAPLVLMAHWDVVPVEVGSDAKWAHAPFSGDIVGGYVWGRGTLDDKLNVVTELEAIDALISVGFKPRRTIILSFGKDEETSGGGADSIAVAFKARGIRPFMVVDEGGAVVSNEVPGLRRPVALIGISEKGVLSIELVAESVGGHSSMPPPQTVTGIVAAAVAKLEHNQLPSRLDGALQESMRAVAPEVSFSARAALANMWLVGPFAKAFLERVPETNAAIRTTTATTIFQAGVKDNVLASRARAVVNFRLLPGDSIATVLEHVRKVVDDPRVRIRQISGAEPSPISDVHSPAYAVLSRTIRQTMPDAVVAPYVLIAATDSRHFTGLTRNVFRFAPMRVGKGDLRRVHGTDERIAVDNVGEAVVFYTNLVRNADEPK